MLPKMPKDSTCDPMHPSKGWLATLASGVEWGGEPGDGGKYGDPREAAGESGMRLILGLEIGFQFRLH